VDRSGEPVPGDPVEATAALLRRGMVVAVKGLGGYHLAVDAASEEAARALRSRKHREDKPFAVMAGTVEEARLLCHIGDDEARVLAGPRRPIVLCRRRPAPVAEAVAPGNRYLGVMLPYTPLHHLLARAFGGPLVLTSGNVSDEPIAYRDDDALERLGPIADAFLLHDREIHMRTDDSVTRVVGGRERILRRSRGQVPQPLAVPWPFPRPVLACGAELKSTFCLVRGRHAFLSHHIGDLENYETLRSFTEGIEHFERLTDVSPEVVAHDLHPEYLSTNYALEREGVDLVGVQHHHAHVASCLAEAGEEGPAIGVAFDGLGFGTDRTFWGGEVLVASLSAFERAGHLEIVPMPGGEAAIREPWRMAAAYLDAAYGDGLPLGLGVVARNERRWGDVLGVARQGVNSPRTSSAGRLFDAVAAILGIRDRINYEGQAAVELEQRADPEERDAYAVTVDGVPDGPVVIRGTDLVRAVVDEASAGIPVPMVAARFHNGLAAAVVAAVTVVAGGAGFRVLTHTAVPPNDGGISLGQAAVAGALDRAGRG